MDKKILHELGFEFNNYEQYITQTIIEGDSTLSQDDFAALCKKNAVDKGFELLSQTSKDAGWCWIYKENALSFEDHIFGCDRKTEHEAIFACFLWILNEEYLNID